ncbi:MAG: hypothetical protein PHZ00_06685 [Candidatus Peribacteraceae bacterium]|nr:hypothetical protein [Candidatus Peribacteraceae bacterium]
MRHIALSLVVILTLSAGIPSSVAANANEQAIRSLYMAMMESKKVPTEFSFDIVADDSSKQPTHLKVHVAGSGQSGEDLQDVQGVKGTFQISVEGSQGKNAIHASAEARIVDANLYVRISKFDMTGVSKDLEEFSVRYVGQWYQLPIDDYVEQALTQTEDIDRSISEISKIFLVTKRSSVRGTQYVIRIRPAIVRQILSKNVPGSQAFFSMNGMAMFTSDNVFQRMTLAMNARAKTPPAPSLFEGSATGRSSEPVDAKATVKFQMKKINAVTVVAPDKFISLQDAIDGWGRSAGVNQLSNARDAQRRSDINTILNANYQYAVDNYGDLPTPLPTTPVHICAAGKECDGVSLDVLIGDYLITIPRDPTLTPASNVSGYMIMFRDDHMTVSAPLSEQAAPMTVTR